MEQNRALSRRRTIRLAGASATAALVAGCLDSYGEESGDETGTDETDDTDDEAASTSAEPTDAEDDAVDDSDADDAETNDVDDGVPEFVLEGLTGGWVGVEPARIEGVENPTLELEAGQEYRLGWRQGDGQAHNIEIRDETGTIVDDLSTSLTNEPADDEFLEFTATEEMATYQCDPHRNNMTGEIQFAGEGTATDESDEEGQSNTEIDREAWRDVQEIALTGVTSSWEGNFPEQIDGAENPTIALVADRTYTIHWKNGDGTVHNFEIRNDDDDPLLTTDFMEENGATKTIEFEASEAMASYVCVPHEGSMHGEIVSLTE